MVCDSCGAEQRPGARFCDECGNRLTAEGEAGGAARPAAPEHLAEKIRAGGAALQGERKQVTVLFADVQGSMDMAEQTDAERWRAIMQSFFRLLCDGVQRYEGTVDKFTGDGIMAIFGAPIAHEDHALRACHAAADLHRALADYAIELRRTDGLNFSARIGLNSGEVVVGGIGDDLAMEYTAMGHTVGLAQRMEALAEPGKTYLTATTAQLVEGYFALTDLGEFNVKGSSRPLRVFELAGEGAARTRLDVARSRGLTPFVGREAELEALTAALDAALAGDGRVVGIVGEAGIGKSRLCDELLQRARERGAAIYSAAGTPHGQNVPFAAALEMMRGYFGVAAEDRPQDARDRIAGRMLLLDAAFADDLPLVFEFMGVPDPDRPAERMSPEARQRRLTDVVRRLVQAQSRRGPAVNFFEDAHWVDAGSAILLEAVVEALPGQRNLTLVNFRPEFRADWMAREWYQGLPVAPLGPAGARELLGRLLGGHPSIDGLAEEIAERTDGNPFFMEEVVRDLAGDGVLEGGPGAYRLVRSLESIRVPATVQAVLAARIDRLDDDEKAIVQAAAVIGRSFEQRLLERVTGRDGGDVALALHRLAEAELIRCDRPHPDAAYSFVHALTQDVAYGSQLAERRQPVHAAVARALQEIHADTLDEHAALIAHHFDAAGDAREAMRWSARAAAWAGINSPAEAVRHWQKVRELSDSLPEDPETLGLGTGARLWILQLGWRLGLPEEEADRLFAEGRERATRSGDDVSRALIGLSYATICTSGGRHELGWPLLVETYRNARELGNPDLMAAVPMPYAYWLHIIGEMGAATEVLDEWLDHCTAYPDAGVGLMARSPRAAALFLKARHLAEGGFVAEASELQREAVETARAAGDIETEGWALMAGAYIAWARLDGPAAVAAGQGALEIADRIGDAFSRVWAHAWCGIGYLGAGDFDSAVRLLDAAIGLSRATRTAVEGDSYRLAFLAEALTGAGDLARALEAGEEAVRIARGRGYDGILALPLVACGRARFAAGDLDGAEALFRECLAHAERIRARLFEAIAHEELAGIASRRGRAAQASAELAAAVELYERIGTAARAEAARARFAVPAAG